jgi:hypothetical protein
MVNNQRVGDDCVQRLGRGAARRLTHARVENLSAPELQFVLVAGEVALDAVSSCVSGVR